MTKASHVWALLAVALVISTGAAAQETWEPPRQEAPPVAPPDTPRGSPYNVVPNSNDVSTRDYLSSRIDANAARVERLNGELQKIIQLVDERITKIMDERNVQYAQRFDAQQKALADALSATKESAANALQAIKETTSNTLAAAKEAVLKAEDANNKRFESVNEFRATLQDQATKFISKDEANARLIGLQEDVAALTKRMDNDNSRSEGMASLWALIGAGVLLAIAVMTFILNRRPILK